MNTDMVLDALNQALWQRSRKGHDDYQHLVAHRQAHPAPSPLNIGKSHNDS